MRRDMLMFIANEIGYGLSSSAEQKMDFLFIYREIRGVYRNPPKVTVSCG